MERNQIKVAIVEDDENLRFLVANRLQRQGYIVLSADNGNDAAELTLTQQPHLALLPCTLPRQQGSEVCQALRAQRFHNTLIMLNAKSQDVKHIHPHNVGLYVTLPKHIQ